MAIVDYHYLSILPNAFFCSRKDLKVHKANQGIDPQHLYFKL